MNISQTIALVRKIGYPLLKYLGDVQAITSDKPGAIERRIARRAAGKVTGHAMGAFDQWLKSLMGGK